MLASILLICLSLQSCRGGSTIVPLTQDGQNKSLKANLNQQATENVNTDRYARDELDNKEESTVLDTEPCLSIEVFRAETDSSTQYYLEKLPYNDKFPGKDSQKANAEFKKSTNRGEKSSSSRSKIINCRKKTEKQITYELNIETIYVLAIAHRCGIGGVEKDNQKSLEYLTKAAQNGHPKAQYELGIMFSRGDDVALDYQESIKWLERSATQGNREAQYELGLLYIQIEDNYEKATQWLTKAANNKYEPAVNQLLFLGYLTALNTNSKDNLWVNFFQNLGAERCWQELQKYTTSLKFDFQEINKRNINLEQHNNTLAGIIHYAVCKQMLIDSLSIQTAIIRLPTSIRKLSTLQNLNLSFTTLNTLPESFGELGQLKHLKLVGNKFQIFPSPIQKLTKLKTLDLSSNKLDIIPASISKLTDLKYLFLEGNNIQRLPTTIGQLTKLKKINLSKNLLNSIPNTLYDLYDSKNLELFLSENPFFKSNELCPLAQEVLKRYVYSSLPCSLHILCANAVLQYAGRVKPYVSSKKGVLQRTWNGLSQFFSYTETPQAIIRPGFEESSLEILPAELSLDNLQILIEQIAYEKGIGNGIIFFKKIGEQVVPLYLPYRCFTLQKVQDMLRRVKDEHIECYLNIS